MPCAHEPEDSACENCMFIGMFAHTQETQPPTSPVPQIVGTNAAARESQEIVTRQSVENAQADKVRVIQDFT
jgi:hypothetical protein